MRRLSLFMILTCCIALAQNASPSEADMQTLRAALLGKSLVLRNFSGDPSVHYVIQGNKLVAESFSRRVLAVFVPDAVEKQGSTLRITGKRLAYVRIQNTGTLAPTKTSASAVLTIDFSGVKDYDDVLADLPYELFFPSIHPASLRLNTRGRKRLQGRYIFPGGKENSSSACLSLFARR